MSRRNFIKALGASSLLLPFGPEKLWAASPAHAKPKRLVILYTPDGTFSPIWTPRAAEPTVQLNLAHQGLEAVKDKIIFIDGMSFNAWRANHDLGHQQALTCGGSVSIDEFVAGQLQAMGMANKTTALHLGVRAEKTEPVVYPFADMIDSPQDAFQILFGSLMPSSSSESNQNLKKRRRLAIADAVKQQLSALMKNAGQATRQKLQNHVDSLNDLEKSLTLSAASCTAPNPPAAGTGSIPEITKGHLDIMINGLACNLMNVAALQFHYESNELQVDWIPGVSGILHSTISHRTIPGAIDMWVKIEQWFASQFLYLIEQLQSRPEPTDPTQTLLDSTLVLWARALGDSSSHMNASVAYLLAGGGSALKYAPGGRYFFGGGLDQIENAFGYPLPFNRPSLVPRYGMPHQRLFATLCQAMGITNMTGFGGGFYPKNMADLEAIPGNDAAHYGAYANLDALPPLAFYPNVNEPISELLG